MSSTDTRLSYDEALFHAGKFRELFDPSTYEAWTVAGSVRRRCRDVGDIEHLARARFADLAGDGLFSEPVPTNLFLREMDRLRAAGTIAPKDFGDGKLCWGAKHRACTFMCLGLAVHDVYLADSDNWGAILGIRSGPSALSKYLVTALRRNGYRQHEGHVWRCEMCRCSRYGDPCRTCGGTGLAPVEKVPVPTEEAYFKLCGAPFVPPEARDEKYLRKLGVL